MEIRLIRPGEEQACNDLHNRLYGANRSLAQWRWAFAENNWDQTPIPYAVVEDGGKIVGTQAFIPIRLIDREGVFWTAKSEATLVDPDYRGQALFEKMYDVLFKFSDEHKYSHIWGFTSAIKPFSRLKFDIPGSTGQLFMPFSSRAVTAMLGKAGGPGGGGAKGGVKAAAFKIGGAAARIISSARGAIGSRKLPSGLEIRTMDEPDEQAGACCERFVKQWGGVTVYRDAAYLKWRLFDNPYVRSVVRAAYSGDELLGWVAYTLGDDGLGYLVDTFIGCDGSRHNHGLLTRALLSDAVYGARNMGALGIRGWSVTDHPFDRLVSRQARKIGFYHVKRGQPVVLYDSPGLTRPSGDTFRDWYVSRICTEGTLG